MQKVQEEWILDNYMEFTLREDLVLGIAKKKFHDTIIDLMKRKRVSIEPKNAKPVDISAVVIDEVAREEDYSESHYTRPH